MAGLHLQLFTRQRSCQTNPNATNTPELLSASSVMVHHWQHVFSSKVLSKYTTYTIYWHDLLALQDLKSYVISCGSSSFKRGQKCALPQATDLPPSPRHSQPTGHATTGQSPAAGARRAAMITAHLSSAPLEEGHLSTAVRNRTLSTCR